MRQNISKLCVWESVFKYSCYSVDPSKIIACRRSLKHIKSINKSPLFQTGFGLQMKQNQKKQLFGQQRENKKQKGFGHQRKKILSDQDSQISSHNLEIKQSAIRTH